MIEPLNKLLDRGLDSITSGQLSVVDQGAREQLLRYVGLLDKWNRVYNLTAVRDPRKMVTRHLLDSLILRPWLPAANTVPDVVLDVVANF